MNYEEKRNEFRQLAITEFSGRSEVCQAIRRAEIVYKEETSTLEFSERINEAHPFVAISGAKLQEIARRVYGSNCYLKYGMHRHAPELMERVFIPGGVKSSMWRRLANFALDENWGDDLSLLRGYIENTFEYLLIMEPDKIFERDGLLAFNTGLVDNAYDDIIMCAKRADGSFSRPYKYFGICTKNRSPEHDGAQIRREVRAAFGDTLPRAQYLRNVYDAIYDVALGEPMFNELDHLILDNIKRLPVGVVANSAPESQDLADALSRRDWGNVRHLVEESGALGSLKRMFEDAVEYAFKQVCWNYKTAIPSFYPAKKQIQLLLPLCFDMVRGRVSNALVVNRETEVFGGVTREVYVAYTVLTMPMAYRNARLITRPDSEWLTADSALRN